MKDPSFQNKKKLGSESVFSRSNEEEEVVCNKIKILIAEDQYTCQQIWQSYLEPELDLEIIGTAVNGKIAVELVEKLQPDVVLMDINMPIMDGLTATEIITNNHSNTKVLILSISDNLEYIEQSFHKGAKGYFLKTSQPQDLVTAIRNIALGYYQLGAGLIEQLSVNIETIPTLQNDQENCHLDLIDPLTTEISTTASSPVNILTSAKSKTQKVSPNLSLSRLLLLGLLTFLLIPFGGKWSNQLSLLATRPKDQPQTYKDVALTNILPVETTEVSLVNSYQVNRTYKGTIMTRRRSSLGFERGGKLLSLIVDQGERVKIDMPLATLETKELKAQKQELLAEKKQVQAGLEELKAGSRQETITAAQSMVKNWQSELKLAQIKAKRRQLLYTSGAISREQLDIAKTEVDTFQARLNESQSKLDELLTGTRPEKITAQQASLEQLDAKLASLEIKIEQSTLKAPFSGVINQRLVDEGTVIAAGESIFNLVEDQSLEVHFDVPINTTNQIPLGSKHQLQIGSKIYQAQVLSTLPQLNPTTRTLTVILGLDQSTGIEVRAGQMAELKLSENIADAGYWLPTSALVRGIQGLWSCYVLGKSELVVDSAHRAFRVEQREVEIIQSESDRVFVRGTIQDKDQVIVNGNHRLVINQLVQAIDPS